MIIDKSIIVSQARTWLGTKYHHQGRLKKSEGCSGGVDCIGLVICIADELKICDNKGVALSKYDNICYSTEPKDLGSYIGSHLTEVPIPEMSIGDILLFKFWKEPQHVGILSNYSEEIFGIIHCNSSSGSVVEQPLSRAWMRMISNVYSLLP